MFEQLGLLIVIKFVVTSDAIVMMLLIKEFLFIQASENILNPINIRWYLDVICVCSKVSHYCLLYSVSRDA